MPEELNANALLTLSVPPDFRLARAVCSYGFFTQAPNSWASQSEILLSSTSKALKRPLLTSADNVFRTVIEQTDQNSASAEQCLRVTLDRPASEDEQHQISIQVHRMLRLSEVETGVLHAFHDKHSQARQEGFGRLFRSPTVWEDIIKSILLCNCGWSRTLTMNKALCAEIGSGAFPSPNMLVDAGLAKLQSQCGLGYRAKSLMRLAEQVACRETDLAKLEDPALSSEEVYQKLLPLPGVGPFTAANMLQLLGHYSRIPCDSETVRHLHKVHRLQGCTLANVQQHAQQVYAKYAPYQFLAYWHELWREYESLVGPFDQLEPERYPLLTGHNMRRAASSGARPPLLGGANLTQPPSPPQLDSQLPSGSTSQLEQQQQLAPPPQVQLHDAAQSQPQTEPQHQPQLQAQGEQKQNRKEDVGVSCAKSQTEKRHPQPASCSGSSPKGISADDNQLGAELDPHPVVQRLDQGPDCCPSADQDIKSPSQQTQECCQGSLAGDGSDLLVAGEQSNRKASLPAKSSIKQGKQSLSGSTTRASTSHKRQMSGNNLQGLVRKSQRIKTQRVPSTSSRTSQRMKC